MSPPATCPGPAGIPRKSFRSLGRTAVSGACSGTTSGFGSPRRLRPCIHKWGIRRHWASAARRGNPGSLPDRKSILRRPEGWWVLVPCFNSSAFAYFSQVYIYSILRIINTPIFWLRLVFFTGCRASLYSLLHGSRLVELVGGSGKRTSKAKWRAALRSCWEQEFQFPMIRQAVRQTPLGGCGVPFLLEV